jgi:hypothetical protein
MSMSCNKTASKGDNKNPGNGCPEDVICTEMFAMVMVQISDINGTPARLDKVETIRKSTGEKINIEQQPMEGQYVVLDDSYVRKLQKQKDDFIFRGYKNNEMVVEETYTISADCCHINKESGAGELTIKQ